MTKTGPPSMYGWRDLDGPTLVLIVASWVTLTLHAAFFTLQVFYSWLESSQVSALLIGGGLLRLSIIGCAAVSLYWLYIASSNAHTLNPQMKHSPGAGVAWFFAPAVNFMMIMSVVYEVWSSSGGDKARGRWIFVWLLLVIASIYTAPAWLLWPGIPWMLQAAIAGATLCFLIIAQRIATLQAFARRTTVFSDEPDYEIPSVADPRPPADYEMADPAFTGVKEYVLGSDPLPSPDRSRPVDGPAPVAVRRPQQPS